MELISNWTTNLVFLWGLLADQQCLSVIYYIMIHCVMTLILITE